MARVSECEPWKAWLPNSPVFRPAGTPFRRRHLFGRLCDPHAVLDAIEPLGRRWSCEVTIDVAHAEHLLSTRKQFSPLAWPTRQRPSCRARPRHIESRAICSLQREEVRRIVARNQGKRLSASQVLRHLDTAALGLEELPTVRRVHSQRRTYMRFAIRVMRRRTSRYGHS